MGYRGKVHQQARARELRATGMRLSDIALELGVAKSSVSLWVRDVPFTPSPRRPRPRGPNKLQRAKQAEIDALLADGRARIGVLSDRDLLIAGTALYAGEGAKRDHAVTFANSDPRMVLLHLAWLRRFFDVDESRLRIRIYLHAGLDLDAATAFWEHTTGVPAQQFHAPYRAAADPTMRTNKHEYGCVSVVYCCTRTHRAIMGLVTALLTSSAVLPG